MTDSALRAVVEAMLNDLVVIGPALSSVGTGGLDDKSYRLIESVARELTFKHWPKPAALQRYPEIIIDPSVIRTGFIETLSSTAAYLSHHRLGYLNMDEAMIRVAHRLLDQFIEEQTVDNVLTLNFMVNSYDNLQLIKHCARVGREQFESGELHRPWIHYSLHDELETMLNLGTVEIERVDGHMSVKLTSSGENRYKILRDFLLETGFLRRRATLMRLTQFSQLDDYDDLIENYLEIVNMRSTLLQHCDIQEGMHVLELGAGTGGLTINAGLYKLVHTSGKIVATEPSLGMLERAKQKAERMGISNIQFLCAAAEELPFPDNTFDAVTGNSFLHFTDIPTAIKEIHRVLKPGGVFSTSAPLSPTYPVFLVEWFAPVFSLTTSSTSRQDIGPNQATIPEAMKGLFSDVVIRDEAFATIYEDPQKVVRFVVQVGNFFEEAMAELPWKAKEDMIELLVERGRDIVSTYPADELRPPHPCQIIRAKALKEN